MSAARQHGTGEEAFSVGLLPLLSDLWEAIGIWGRMTLVLGSLIATRLLAGLW